MIVLLAEVVTAVGQILFKKSANKLERYSLRGLDRHMGFIKSLLIQPSIWAGLVFMSAGMVIWLVALAEGPLSLVFSLGSMQYLLILFGAHVFLGEKIEKNKVIGTVLVMLGIVLITMS